MNIYCLEDFKVEFDKLKSKNSYKSIEKDIIDYFFTKTKEELRSGTRLNHSDEAPYIKKRIGGRGGFRFYFLLILVKDSLYLMYVHPKTGSKGVDNITDESKAYLYKKVLECIKEENNLYRLSLNSSNKEILFEKIARVES
ncbi:hypothetical protein ACQY1Q_06675 [Tenacibaculum sp. TC6]|uniref:hypothetical protein n=1 Tax=Tenacibaculum sp. TC6 TaxID=3423223 RepID=UPI003D36839A